MKTNFLDQKLVSQKNPLEIKLSLFLTKDFWSVFFSLQAKYNNKNNAILMGFDTIEINLVQLGLTPTPLLKSENFEYQIYL